MTLDGRMREMGDFGIWDDRLRLDFLSQSSETSSQDDPDYRTSDRPAIANGHRSLFDVFPAVMIHRAILALEGAGQ
jgi:hypothetical protein